MCVYVCRTVPVVSTGQAPCVVLPLKYEPVDATAFLIHDDSKCVLSTISRSFCFHGGVCTGSRTSALASPALLVSAPHDRIAQTRPHSSWRHNVEHHTRGPGGKCTHTVCLSQPATGEVRSLRTRLYAPTSTSAMQRWRTPHAAAASGLHVATLTPLSRMSTYLQCRQGARLTPVARAGWGSTVPHKQQGSNARAEVGSRAQRGAGCLGQQPSARRFPHVLDCPTAVAMHPP